MPVLTYQGTIQRKAHRFAAVNPLQMSYDKQQQLVGNLATWDLETAILRLYICCLSGGQLRALTAQERGREFIWKGQKHCHWIYLEYEG